MSANPFHEDATIETSDRDEFAGLLARWIEHLLVEPDGTYLIIEQDWPMRYVQFIVSGDGDLTGEAVGNEYLDGDDRLTAEQEEALEELWGSPQQNGGIGAGNYWRMWGASIDTRSVAELAVATLMDIFRLKDPRDLDVQVGRQVR